MNVENMKRTIEVLKNAPDENFSMEYWIIKGNGQHVSTTDSMPATPACKTTACIAGHIAFNFKSELIKHTSIRAAARRFLALNEDEADFLFCGHFTSVELERITKASAIREMERMIQRHLAKQPVIQIDPYIHPDH